LRDLRTILITLLGSLVLLLLGGLVFIYTGSYNVAATAPHSGLGSWILRTTKEHSIEANARDVNVPAVGGAQLQHGIEHFHEMCVACHGAPGVEKGELGQGLNPTPPDLAHAAEEWNPGELYWIVKHGIKLAGMPAFGPTHSDEEIWGIVSFVQQLPNISADEYRQLTASLSQPQEHGSPTEPPTDQAEADHTTHSHGSATDGPEEEHTH
jgi:mono/diheme cytochrome c family protein